MKGKKGELIVKTVVLAFITIGYLITDNRMGFYDERLYSISDVWISMMSPLSYTILVVPYLLVGTAYSMRSDFLNNRILCYSFKWEIMKEQCKRAFVYSAQIAVIYLSMGVLFGVVKGWKFCNWYKTNSYFCINNRCIFQGSIFEIILVTLFLCLLRNMLISMSVILSKWYLKNVVSGFFIPISICIFEITQTCLSNTENIHIFLRRLIADYPFWISIKTRGVVVLSILLYGVLIFILTKIIVKKKEFLYGKKF